MTKKRIRALGSIDADAVILFNLSGGNPNFFYFTDRDAQGIWFYDFHKAVLLTSEMETPRARSNVKIIRKLDSFISSLPKRVAIDGMHTSFALAQKLRKNRRLVDISAVLEHARMIKDRDEISRIANASKASARIIKNLSISGTESSLAADLDWNIRKSGNKNAFDTIVATGNNIKTPHHTPTNKQLGKTVLIDLGVNYRGYCSDMARTFGSPYEKIVQSVLSDIEEKMAPGVSCSDLDALARKALGKYRKKFITSLGHGVGIAIHEKPSISAASKDILRKGMVIAVEPAIYASNGCRIENTYLITENGCKNLTA